MTQALSPPTSAWTDLPGWRGRTLRYAVDALVYGFAVTMGLVLVGASLDVPDPPSDALVFMDVVVGGLVSLSLWWRRRQPVVLALVAAAATSFSDVSAPTALILLFTVAVRRPLRAVVPVAAANLVASVVYVVFRPDPTVPWVLVGGLVAVVITAIVGWGTYVRSRAELLESLRERALHTEAAQLARVEEARASERTRIAREMHDVLAHRISLVSLHAGALEYNAAAAPADVAASAALIRGTAHAALEDVREILGVLQVGDLGPEGRPVPTLSDLDRLVDECTAAGMQVACDVRLPTADIPPVIGRTAYRVVQEGLTNARKHAPGAPVQVTVEARRTADGVPDRADPAGPGLLVTVTTQPLGASRSPGTAGTSAIPGTGRGLTGLTERVGLAGGRLRHDSTPVGGHRLEAWLPWPA